MFAENWEQAGEVHSKLLSDGYVGEQDIYIREFVPLNTYCIGIQGLPVTEEYRFFVLDGQIVAKGFYWSEHTDYLANRSVYPHVKEVPASLTHAVISKVKDKIRFFVFDVARTADGKWIVIELNDGQMSGLSDICPHSLYKSMKDVLSSPNVV